MFDYRLFFAGSTLDEGQVTRRPQVGHHDKRVFRLPVEKREQRTRARR